MASTRDKKEQFVRQNRTEVGEKGKGRRGRRLKAHQETERPNENASHQRVEGGIRPASLSRRGERVEKSVRVPGQTRPRAKAYFRQPGSRLLLDLSFLRTLPRRCSNLEKEPGERPDSREDEGIDEQRVLVADFDDEEANDDGIDSSEETRSRDSDSCSKTEETN